MDLFIWVKFKYPTGKQIGVGRFGQYNDTSKPYKTLTGARSRAKDLRITFPTAEIEINTENPFKEEEELS